MKVIEPSVEILTKLNGNKILKSLEEYGRTCYKSEKKITNDSCIKFITSIVKSGHHSVLEHASFTARFIVSRATSHQLVRHRLIAVSQESQRYCNYNADKFDKRVTFIRPHNLIDTSEVPSPYQIWYQCMEACEKSYMQMIDMGMPAQVARECLPNSVKTELVVTANLREWRHILTLRTAKGSDDGIKFIMRELLNMVKESIPIVFDDILPKENGNV